MVLTKKTDDPVAEAIQLAGPVLGNLSFGALMGYCSGMAMLKVGKALAFCVGVGFVGLQTAASLGYITVDWERISKDCVSKIDHDQDGEITVKDVKAWWIKFKTIMVHRVPSAGGFSMGFLYGVRYG